MIFIDYVATLRSISLGLTAHYCAGRSTGPGNPGSGVLPAMHQELAKRGLLPSRQFVDAGYSDSDILATQQARFKVEVLAPTRGDFRWQAREQTGFEGHHFTIDWKAQRAICPQGHASRRWTVGYDRRHAQPREMMTVTFSAADCRPCPSRAQCTQAPPRTITLRPRAHELTKEFATAYAARAGIEGTHAQGLRVCGLRRSRYIGQPKTHLQHILSAVAINSLRIAAWLNGAPLASTRQSSFAHLMAQAA